MAAYKAPLVTQNINNLFWEKLNLPVLNFQLIFNGQVTINRILSLNLALQWGVAVLKNPSSLTRPGYDLVKSKVQKPKSFTHYFNGTKIQNTN